MATIQNERDAIRQTSLAVLRAKRNQRLGKPLSVDDKLALAYKRFDGRNPDDLSAHYKRVEAASVIESTDWEQWTSNSEYFQRLLTFLIDIKGSSSDERALLCFGCGTVDAKKYDDVEFPNNCFVERTNSLIAFHSPECLKKYWKVRKSFIKWIQI